MKKFFYLKADYNRISYLIGFLILITGFVLGVSAFYGATFFKKYFLRVNSKEVNNDIHKPIEAPYYSTEVFHLPAEFKNKTKEQKISLPKVKLPIIMYHYVEYVKDFGDIIRKRLDITPDVFNEQLNTLHKAGYRTYWVKDVPEIIAGNIIPSQKSVILTFDDGYEDFYTVVFPLLKKYQMKATIFIINDFIGKRGFLNDKEIREILASGLVEVGSHTLDHVYLKFLPDTIAKKQILESKRLLEERFGIKVESFAYPYGAFNKNTVELVKNSGYKAAVSVIPGVYQGEDNLFYLYRLRPGLFMPKTIDKFLENYNK